MEFAYLCTFHNNRQASEGVLDHTVYYMQGIICTDIPEAKQESIIDFLKLANISTLLRHDLAKLWKSYRSRVFETISQERLPWHSILKNK